MIGIIDNIITFLRIRRDGSGPEKGKKKPGQVRRPKDTVTISAEARRLLAGRGGDGRNVDEEKVWTIER